MRRRWTIGSRGSPLALWQTRHVREMLEAAHDGIEVDVRVIRTEGDRQTGQPLQALGGKGFFVKEIEQALQDGSIDLAVHSLKDLPSELPGGLLLAAILERHDPRDALLSVQGRTLEGLPQGSSLATGSLRRRCQLLHRRPDLVAQDVRGNVDTRIRKLTEGRFDSLVLAVAGVQRLGLDRVPVQPIPPEVCLPAVGQGAMAVETRADDSAARTLLAPLQHAATLRAVTAERCFLARLGGGCMAPATAFASVADSRVEVRAIVGDPEGRRLLRSAVHGRAGEEERLGVRLAERLLEAGAEQILEECRGGARS